MKNNQIKAKVLEQIKQSKLNAEAKADAVLSKALKNEQFKKLYQNYKSLNLENSKLQFLGKDGKQIQTKLKETGAKLVKSLKDMNLSPEDFKPKYSCQICCDTATVEGDYCTCYYKKLNEALIKNLGALVSPNHTFENSDYTIFDDADKTKKLYNKIESWCNKLPDTKYKTLVLSGNTGVGKTYLTECICNKLISKNLVVNYYSSFSLNDLFYKYHTSFAENKSGLLDGVLSCDVLIIDDFGAEPKVKSTEDYFYAIINERLVKNKFTIISTNLLPLQILDRYGERTFSRLNNKASSVMLKIDNKDLRLKR